MKAFVYTRYGSPDVLQLTEVASPALADNQVLIKICAASVNPLDWHFMRGEPLFIRLITGLRKPKHNVLGSDIAGRVEAVGANVKLFQPGDEVFGGLGVGGFAEYACATEDRLSLKPANLSFEEAAAVPIAAVTALQGLRDKGKIKPGCKVLIDGASGGVGTFAIQIAKSFGAEVTAVCSTGKLDTARSIGADHAIDYTREDFTRSGLLYDLILGANAYHSLFDYRRALSPDGIFVSVGGNASFLGMLEGMLVAPLLSMIGHKKTCVVIANMNSKDLDFLKDLLETGKVVPVIDRRYPFSELTEAIRYLEDGHARGKVVIAFDDDSSTRSTGFESRAVKLG
jgi:NADPH:quinone reductase-like Zn-dependent oxidoreductase